MIKELGHQEHKKLAEVWKRQPIQLYAYQEGTHSLCINQIVKSKSEGQNTEAVDTLMSWSEIARGEKMVGTVHEFTAT